MMQICDPAELEDMICDSIKILTYGMFRVFEWLSP